METINTIESACATAATAIASEVKKRRRLNPRFNPNELWAAVTRDAIVRVGTPLLRPGQGYYINHRGERWEV